MVGDVTLVYFSSEPGQAVTPVSRIISKVRTRLQTGRYLNLRFGDDSVGPIQPEQPGIVLYSLTVATQSISMSNGPAMPQRI